MGVIVTRLLTTPGTLVHVLASKMAVEDASVVVEHLTGIQLPRATLAREARRQGERAQRRRAQLDQPAATDKQQLELTLEPYQMIIQMGDWNVRERDEWGQSAQLRRARPEPESRPRGPLPPPVLGRECSWV